MFSEYNRMNYVLLSLFTLLRHQTGGPFIVGTSNRLSASGIHINRFSAPFVPATSTAFKLSLSASDFRSGISRALVFSSWTLVAERTTYSESSDVVYTQFIEKWIRM